MKLQDNTRQNPHQFLLLVLKNVYFHLEFLLVCSCSICHYGNLYFIKQLARSDFALTANWQLTPFLSFFARARFVSQPCPMISHGSNRKVWSSNDAFTSFLPVVSLDWFCVVWFQWVSFFSMVLPPRRKLFKFYFLRRLEFSNCHILLKRVQMLYSENSFFPSRTYPKLHNEKWS